MAKVVGNDISELEATLTAQAATLDAMFNSMAARAALNMGQHINAADTYMRLALKAQNQCRNTIQTIGELKYPKSPTFIRQANIAGQQQVNNGRVDSATNTQPSEHTREKNINPSNELLSETRHETLDAGRSTTPVRANQELETMGEVDRA